MQPVSKTDVAREGGEQHRQQQNSEAGHRTFSPPKNGCWQHQQGGEQEAPDGGQLVDKAATQQGIDGLRLNLRPQHERCVKQAAPIGRQMGIVHAAVTGPDHHHFATQRLNFWIAQRLRLEQFAQRQGGHAAGRAGVGEGEAILRLQAAPAELPLFCIDQLLAGVNRHQEGQGKQAQIVFVAVNRWNRRKISQGAVAIGLQVGGADKTHRIEIGQRNQIIRRRQQGFLRRLHTGKQHLAARQFLTESLVKVTGSTSL